MVDGASLNHVLEQLSAALPSPLPAVGTGFCNPGDPFPALTVHNRDSLTVTPWGPPLPNTSSSERKEAMTQLPLCPGLDPALLVWPRVC